MNSNTKNRDLEITARLPRETMRDVIELANVTRALNSAEWVTGWSVPTMSASMEVL